MDTPSTPPAQPRSQRAGSFVSPRSTNSNSQEAYTSLSDLMKQQKQKPQGTSSPRNRKGPPNQEGSSQTRGPRFTVGEGRDGNRTQNYGAVSDAAAAAKEKKKNRNKKLSFNQLLALTVSMGGSQVSQRQSGSHIALKAVPKSFLSWNLVAHADCLGTLLHLSIMRFLSHKLIMMRKFSLPLGGRARLRNSLSPLPRFVGTTDISSLVGWSEYVCSLSYSI